MQIIKWDILGLAKDTVDNEGVVLLLLKIYACFTHVYKFQNWYL